MTWSLEIDGLEFEPIPENWIKAGVDDREPDGPQLLAVSVALLRNSTLKVRYAHPEYDTVGAMFFPTLQEQTLPDDKGRTWRRSIGAARLEPVGTIRAPEREHLETLWSDRVHDVLKEPDRFETRRTVADGGHSLDGTDRIRTPKAAAVQQWKSALEDLPDNAEWAETLRSADIHDEWDRMEIEEVIEFEVPEDHYLPLHDAFDDLQSAFEGWWS